MSNDFARKRIKKKLEQIKDAMSNLDKMTQEQIQQVFVLIDSIYEQLVFLNERILNEHIEEFDNKVKVLDENIDNANKVVLDAFKKKIDFYKEAYSLLLSEL
jgi:DNA-binding transcriptional MerR regulator